MVRQSIRIATSYGPDNYDYRIDSRDKEITNSSYSSSSSSSSSSSHAHSSAKNKRILKRSAADCERSTEHVEKCECCGGYAHSTYHCRWSIHPMANNSLKNFNNSTSAAIWRTIGSDKLKPGITVPGFDPIRKDDYRKLDNVYNKERNGSNKEHKNIRSKVSANYKGNNPKPYDLLYNKNNNNNNNNNND